MAAAGVNWDNHAVDNASWPALKVLLCARCRARHSLLVGVWTPPLQANALLRSH